MPCVKFEYQTTSGNRVIRLYKDIRRRFMNDSFNLRYSTVWKKLRGAGIIKPTPSYKLQRSVC